MEHTERDEVEGRPAYVRADEIEACPSGEERYARLKRMVSEHSFATFAYDNKSGCIIFDVCTANLCVQVADAFSKHDNRAKFLNLDIMRMVDVAWKLVS